MYRLLFLLCYASIVASRCTEYTDGHVVCDDGDDGMLSGVFAFAFIVPLFIVIFWCVPYNFNTPIAVVTNKTPSV